jgi:magnesium-transporting ATPase (P-type)
MITFTQFLDYLANLISFSMFCATRPINFTGCNKFWGVSILIAFLILLYIFISITRKLIRDRKDWNNYLKKKADRAKVADPEVMSKHKWNGDL